MGLRPSRRGCELPISMKRWYYLEKGNSVGPLTPKQLIAENLDQDTQVAEEGSAVWQPLSDVLPKLREATQTTKGLFIETTASTRVLGVLLFVIGLGIMFFFLILFETAVGSGSQSVNNIGLLNDRQCGVNAGGFLMLTGAVLLVASSEWQVVRRKSPAPRA